MKKKSPEVGKGTLAADAKSRRLADAVRSARREVEGFDEGYRSAGVIGGVLEMLQRIVVTDDGLPPKDVDWLAIADVLDDARGRAANLCAAMGHLRSFENEEAANG